MKQMIGKRGAALLLAGMLLLLLCTGCGNQTEAPKSTETPAASAPAASAAPAETPVPTEAPAETPAPTEAPAETPAPTEAPAETPAPTETPAETPTPTEAPAETDGSVIIVSTAEELIKAIGPDREIVLQAGTYLLSEWSEQASKTSKNGYRTKYVSTVNVGDGYEVVISGVSGMTISGTGADTEIVIDPRYADVLSFEDCTDLSLRNFSAGHTVRIGAGDCGADVLSFTGCSRIRLSGLDLYGCGVYGLSAWSTSDLTLSDSTIHDCAYGAIDIFDSKDIRFENCIMRDCRNSAGLTLLDAYQAELSFDHCKFCDNANLYSFLTDGYENIYSFKGCSFGTWETEQIEALADSEAVSFDENCVYGIPASDIRENGESITVTNVQEFFDAIASDVTIRMEPGIYNLTEWLDTAWRECGSVEVWSNTHDEVKIGCVFDGYEPVFCFLENLSIAGSSGNREDVEILIEPRYADVLGFSTCSGITISDVTIGHTERGDCSGDVLRFENCSDVSLMNVDLFGCGVMGITFRNSRNLHVFDSIIHDCSGSAVDFESFAGVIDFCGSELTDCAGAYVGWFEPEEASVSFTNCTFGEWESNMLCFDERIRFEDCSWHEITSYPDYSDEGYYDWEPFGADFEIVRFDGYILQDQNWTAVWFNDAENGVEVDFSNPADLAMFWGVDSKAPALYFYGDGTGLLDGYYEENVSFTWYCDSDYSAVLTMDNGEEACVTVNADYLDEAHTEAQLFVVMKIGSGISWFN